MQETYEFEGKTTDEAVEHACRELNLPKEELDIEVLEPGSAGIFGLVGGRKAKIKVLVEKEEPQAHAESNGMALAKETLEKILALIPVEEAMVKVEQVNGAITLDIRGDKSGLLIGRKGRTLDALQFIVNKIVNKALEKRTQVVIDSEDYRQRRQDALTQMAQRMGEKAKRTGRPVSTNLLNPHERRIIHLALRDDQELDTKSRGDGVLKKVLILPRGQKS